MIILELKRMPPMIIGHPDLEPSWLCPDGGAPPPIPDGGHPFFLPDTMAFENTEEEGLDEFELDLIWHMSIPLTLPWRSFPEVSVGSRKLMDEWMMENDPAWPRNLRPIGFKQDLRNRL